MVTGLGSTGARPVKGGSLGINAWIRLGAVRAVGIYPLGQYLTLKTEQRDEFLKRDIFGGRGMALSVSGGEAEGI